MKHQFLTVTEHHPDHTSDPGQVVRQTIIRWLTAELHRRERRISGEV